MAVHIKYAALMLFAALFCYCQAFAALDNEAMNDSLQPLPATASCNRFRSYCTSGLA